VSVAIRVLIVDDDVPTRVGLRTILATEAGIEVVGEAATGAEAMSLVGRVRPDIVLMDVNLPGEDGIEVTARITGTLVGDDCPRVIVLTTFDYDDYVYRSLRAGASGFLLKRTRAEVIVEAVRSVARGEELPVPVLTTGLISRFASRSVGPQASTLTERETEVLVLVAQGLSNQEIAGRLYVSVETVRTHVKRIYAKLGVRDRVHAVIAAYESGLASRPSG